MSVFSILQITLLCIIIITFLSMSQGYFSVGLHANNHTACYLYGTRASADLYAQKHHWTRVTPIEVRVLDSMGNTTQEVMDVIPSALLSYVPPPPLKKRKKGIIECPRCQQEVKLLVGQHCTACNQKEKEEKEQEPGRIKTSIQCTECEAWVISYLIEGLCLECFTAKEEKDGLIQMNPLV